MTHQSGSNRFGTARTSVITEESGQVEFSFRTGSAVREPMTEFDNDSAGSRGSPYRGEIARTGSCQAGSPTREEGDRYAPPPGIRGGPDNEPPTGGLTGRSIAPNRPNRGPELRPYQADAIAGVESEFDAGRKSTLLVLPTGTGKTVVFAELVRRELARSCRALVLAHREELLDQAARKLAEVGVTASIEQADRRATLHTGCVVASVQSLQRKRLERFAPDAFSLVVVDEAHHAAAKSYRNVLERFPDARILGVTATPDRGDGKALGDVFESVAFSLVMRQAIRDGWLASITARRVLVGDLDLSSIRSHHGDFDQGDLAKVLADEKVLHGVVAPTLELACARKSLVFGVDVAHAHALAEMFNRYRPHSAIAVDGTASRAERGAALAMWRRGQFQFLVNCALYVEGFDEPGVECIVMARPTQSRALYTQMLGRGTRLAEGKTDVLALDFVGNSRHRLVGPADALAAGMDEGTREQVDRLLAEGGDVEAAILEAERLAAKKRAETALLAIAVFRQHEVDPFIGDQMPPPNPNAPWASEPATEKQLAALDTRGIAKPPPGLTRGEASRMLDALVERDRLGLATIPQCRLLARYKLDTRSMTKARATELILKAKAGGWKPWTVMHEPEARRSAKPNVGNTDHREEW